MSPIRDLLSFFCLHRCPSQRGFMPLDAHPACCVIKAFQSTPPSVQKALNVSPTPRSEAGEDLSTGENSGTRLLDLEVGWSRHQPRQ